MNAVIARREQKPVSLPKDLVRRIEHDVSEALERKDFPEVVRLSKKLIRDAWTDK